MRPRSRLARVLIGLAVLGLVAVSAALVFVWRAPLTALAVAGRTALRLGGFEQTAVPVRFGRIVYYRAGTGPVLLFVHGANDQSGTWARVAPALTGSHRVIVADLAGHGGSDPAEGPLSVSQLVEGLSAVVRAERGAAPMTIVGNSLGGWLALVFAIDHPDEVGRAILVNGAINRSDRAGAAVTLLPKTRDEAARTMDVLTSPASPRVPGFVLDDLVRRAPSSPLARLMAQPDGEVERLLIDDRLDRLRIPVTLIWGADDRLLSIDYARTAAARIPGARLDVIPGCGHVPQRECPDRLLASLRQALSTDAGR
jgi:pimeloyl-ACP methyl ester carboxylesterase